MSVLMWAAIACLVAALILAVVYGRKNESSVLGALGVVLAGIQAARGRSRDPEPDSDLGPHIPREDHEKTDQDLLDHHARVDAIDANARDGATDSVAKALELLDKHDRNTHR